MDKEAVNLDLRLPPSQEFLLDPVKHLVLSAGRRWGKTYASTLWILQKLLTVMHKRGLWIDTKQANIDKYIERYFHPILGQLFKNCQWNVQKKVLTFWNKSYIDFGSAERPENLEGFEYDYVVLNEAGTILDDESLWYNTIQPMTQNAQVRFIGTPKGKNLFYTLYLLGLSNTNPDYKSFTFTSLESPYVDRETMEEWQSTMSVTAYQQEILAKFVSYEGLVYDIFSQQKHVMKIDDRAIKVRYRSMDFGTHNPTVCLWIGLDYDDNIYVYDEYYQAGRTFQEHSKTILEKSMGQNIVKTFADPSAKQMILEFQKLGITCLPAKNDVMAGIQKVYEKLKQGKLFVDPKCVNTIREFETYSWEQSRHGSLVKEQPKKVADHAMDSIKYFILSVNTPDKPRSKYEQYFQPREDQYVEESVTGW